jgi:hypothetical protein
MIRVNFNTSGINSENLARLPMENKFKHTLLSANGSLKSLNIENVNTSFQPKPNNKI